MVLSRRKVSSDGNEEERMYMEAIRFLSPGA